MQDCIECNECGVDDVGGLREQKKASTRRELRQVALLLVSEHGLEGVTVEGIAHQAGVSTRTFFNYYATKEEALVGFDDSDLVDLKDQIVNAPAGHDDLAVLEGFLQEAVEIHQSEHGTWCLRRKVLDDNPSLLGRHLAALSRLEETLVEAFDARNNRPTPSLESLILAGVATSTFRTTTHLVRNGRDARATLRDTIEYLRSGLSTRTSSHATHHETNERP